MSTSTSEQVRFACSFADRNHGTLGLVTPGIIADYAERHGLATLRFNNECGGFLAWRHNWLYTHVVYTAVEEPIRLLRNACALLTLVAADAIQNGNTILRLACAADLPSNKFWRTIGSRLVSVDNGRNGRSRTRNWYEIDVVRFADSPYAEELEPCNQSNRFRVPSLASVDLVWPGTLDLTRSGQPAATSLSSFLAAHQTNRPQTLSYVNGHALLLPSNTGNNEARRNVRIGTLSPRSFRCALRG